MSRQSRELKKQQERAKKYGCDGRCYWSTGMCPSVEICDETRVGEAIATAIGLITVLAMIAMVPIIVIGGAIMLIWSIFVCRIRRKKEWRTIKFMITQTHTWKAT